MLFVNINNKELHINQVVSIYNAALQLNIQIPTFCYNEKESIAGNCRMCLVEVKGMPKLVASCAFTISDGMEINTQSVAVKKAREYVLEYLLANHPLDCPICDQGGECDLQDITMVYGRDKGRFYFEKRAISDVSLGLLVTTSFNRCIQCTKCVRFLDEIANYFKLGMIGRSKNSMIDKFLDKNEFFQNSLVSNIVDVCPVGALTSKVYNFKGRQWELQRLGSVDIFDSLGSSIYIETRELNIVRILPHVDFLLNEDWLSDKVRYNFDGFFVNRVDNPCVNLKLDYTFHFKGFTFCLKRVRLRNVNYSFLFKVYKEDVIISKNLSGMHVIVGNDSSVDSLLFLKHFYYNFNLSGFYSVNSVIHDLVFDNYLFSTKSIESSDFILVVGLNLSRESTLLSIRLRKAIQNGSRVFIIGNNLDNISGVTKLSNNLDTFFKILQGKHYICYDLLLAKNPLILLSNDRSLFLDNFSSHFLYNKMFYISSFIGTLALNEIGVVNNNFNSGLYYLFQCEDLVFSSNSYVISQSTHFDFSFNFSDLVVPFNLFVEEDFFYFTLTGLLKRTNALNLSYLSDFKFNSSFNFILFLIKFFDPNFNFNLSFIFAQFSFKFSSSVDYSYNKNSVNKLFSFKLAPLGFGFNLFSNFYSSDVISRNSLVMSKLALKHNYYI